jgi:hypothetical protein
MQWMKPLMLLWNGSDKDGNVGNSCDDDEGTNFEDGESDTER